ncbi:ExbD/TolR family protein [Qipengyuania sediminis]|uniref:ExbD/TolR family protein n=1 Tax=Qipengyuania sediminis TaxID=1532023 RepID=UPI00105A6E41|nr:biopolymer transporter ExbD [Qipengyuania sediminis]
MAMSGGKDDGAPMMEMNMTPLIDVLLCLLIIFIMSIPVATHSVDIDLPTPSPVPANFVEPVKNKLILNSGGQILWNGNVINEGQLVSLLQISTQTNPEPELQFEPEARASYEQAARVLNLIKASGVTRFGFVGNEQYRVFGKVG